MRCSLFLTLCDFCQALMSALLTAFYFSVNTWCILFLLTLRIVLLCILKLHIVMSEDYVCPTLCFLHSRIVSFASLCWLSILSCKESRPIMRFRRKPYRNVRFILHLYQYAVICANFGCIEMRLWLPIVSTTINPCQMAMVVTQLPPQSKTLAI